jgi:hypothetical protein
LHIDGSSVEVFQSKLISKLAWPDFVWLLLTGCHCSEVAVNIGLTLPFHIKHFLLLLFIGYFTSRNYPDDYPAYTSESWIILVPTGQYSKIINFSILYLKTLGKVVLGSRLMGSLIMVSIG